MEYAKPVVRAAVHVIAPGFVADIVDAALNEIEKSIVDPRLSAEFSRERDAISVCMSCVKHMIGNSSLDRELCNLVDALQAAATPGGDDKSSRIELLKAARKRFQGSASMLVGAANYGQTAATNYAARRPWRRLLPLLRPLASCSADEYDLLTAFAEPRIHPSPVTAQDHARWSEDLPTIYISSLFDGASLYTLTPDAAAAQFLAHLQADEAWQKLLTVQRAVFATMQRAESDAGRNDL